MRFGLQRPERDDLHRLRGGTHAIGYAARLIAWGLADAVVTGGSEARRHADIDGRLRQHDRAVVARAPAARSTPTATGS